MQSTLQTLSDAELERLAADIQKRKPWFRPDYGLAYFIRRWMLTIGMFYAFAVMREAASFSFWLIFLAFFVDIFITRKFAWDIRLSTFDMLKVMRDRKGASPYALVKLFGGITFCAIGFGVLLLLSRLEIITETRAASCVVWWMFFSLLWLSINGTKLFILSDLWFADWECRGHIFGKPIIGESVFHPFYGNIPIVNTFILSHPIVVFVLLLANCTFVYGILNYWAFVPFTFKPEVALQKEILMSVVGPLLCIGLFSIICRATWWLKLHKINKIQGI